MSRNALLSLPALALLAACASKPAQPEAPLVPYTCNGEPTHLNADYYSNSRPRVVLSYNDTKLTLYPTDPLPTAHQGGQRYTDSRNPAKPGTHVWWQKGSEAILYQVKTRTNGSAYESQLANCTSNPQPLPQGPAALPVPNPLPGTIPGTAPGIIYAPQPTTI